MALVVVALATLGLTGAARAQSGDTVAAGSDYTVSGSGFAPGSAGLVNLMSEPVHVGSFTADDAGRATVTVTIPASTTPGDHQLVLAGTAPNGSLQYVIVPIVVVAPGTAAPTPAPDTSVMANTGSGNGFLALAALALLVLGSTYLGVGHTLARPLAVVAAPVARVRLRLRPASAPPAPIRLRRRR